MKLAKRYLGMHEGQAIEPSDEIQKFLDNVESAFKKEFKNGYYLGRLEKGLGSPHLYFHFSLIGDTKDLSGGYRDNDPMQHKMMIHDPIKLEDGSTMEKMTIELIVGGSLSVKPDADSYLAMGRVKFGWRKKSGSLSQIEKHLIDYFKKMKKVVDANKENIYGASKIDKKYL